MGAVGSSPHTLEGLRGEVIRHVNALKELTFLTYDDFLKQVEELNRISKQLPDSSGKILLFMVQKGTTSTLLWKTAVRIACIRVKPSHSALIFELDGSTGKMDSFRLLNLRQFLRVYNSLMICANAKTSASAISPQQHSVANPLSPSLIFDGLEDCCSSETELECCICMERKPEVTLPCAHSYCLFCIEQWNVSNKTCPVCREKLDSTTESWVISEAPDAAEIDEELKKALSSIGQECSQSLPP